MTLKHENLNVFADESSISSQQTDEIARLSRAGFSNIHRNRDLSDSAQDEIKLSAVNKVVGVKEARTQFNILQELVKNTTPPVYKVTDGEDPDFGKFKSVSDDTVVIDPDLL